MKKKKLQKRYIIMIVFATLVCILLVAALIANLSGKDISDIPPAALTIVLCFVVLLPALLITLLIFARKSKSNKHKHKHNSDGTHD